MKGLPWQPGPRLALSAVFWMNGTVFGNWVTRIPAIKEEFALSEAAIGLVLLCLGLGALAAMTATGWLLTRVSSRRVVMLSASGFCLSLAIPALAPNVAVLVLGVVLLGGCNGMLDIAMNTNGIELEEALGRRIFSSLHGLWSIGGLTGAAMGGALAEHGVSLPVHFLSVAAGALLFKAFFFSGLRPGAAAEAGEERPPTFVRPPRALYGLAFIAFSVFLMEGAVADWSGLYLRETLGAGPAVAAAGFAFFSLCMAAGRLCGDRLHLPAPKLIRLGGVLALAGLAVALLAPVPAGAVPGFALLGLGLSTLFPTVISRAARHPGVPSALGIAAVATAGYTGFLLGPGVIGFVAEATSVRFALGLLAGLCAGVMLAARSAKAGA